MKLFHSDSVSQFPQWFLNTFIIACFTCVISTMFVLMVAYATSVMRFKMRKPLMNMAVILNLFPGMLAMIAVYFTLKSFNLTNSYAGLIMVYSASSGLGYLIAKGFFDTIPVAIDEAALLDGCTRWQTYWKIVFPLLKPTIATVAIIDAMAFWNDYLLPSLVLGRKELYTLPIATQAFYGTYSTDLGLVMAALLLAMLPILVLYLFLQRYIVEGVTSGAVKG